MPKMIKNCPACNSTLLVSSLLCPNCKMELRGEFEMNPFDRLSDDQTAFLYSFLKSRGNLSAVQANLQISYPTAKKRLDKLLVQLGLEEKETSDENKEKLDMTNWTYDETSHKASDIIRAKLKACGGRVVVHTARGLPCEIVVSPDGRAFTCDKLPITPPYRFEVFDVIVDLLLANNGKARKGNGRNHRLGEAECDETTVVGAIAYNYAGKKTGSSVFDPVFALAAVLDWAEIASNERGEIVLTASYRNTL
ncbi:MAG: DUF2089 domain-containing protein [Oscillospiraceae bacterium]|nr:DUF2089 domain-containing protein [Oscillospiraceae bacterium]